LWQEKIRPNRVVVWPYSQCHSGLSVTPFGQNASAVPPWLFRRKAEAWRNMTGLKRKKCNIGIAF